MRYTHHEKHMKRFVLLFALLAAGASCRAQVVTLDECQQFAQENYPVIAQQELIEKLAEFNVSNARRNWLPQISVSAMASYLSQVPEIPASLQSLLAIGNVDVGSFSHGLYGASVQVKQPIWDGGLIGAQVAAAKAEGEVSRRSWEAEMYAVRERVNQLYFGTLLLQENIGLADLLIADLERNYRMLESMQTFGTDDRNDLDQLRVEILGARQQRAQLVSSRAVYLAMLGVMTGQPFTEETRLERPVAVDLSQSTGDKRPEMALLDAQQQLLDAQRRAVRASVMPQIGAFAWGMYTNPGPDIFRSMKDHCYWSPYVFAGVSLSWNIGGFYTKKNRMAQIALNERRLESQRETFLYNIRLQSMQERAAIAEMQEVMRYDEEIIALRESIRRRTEASVKNGEASVNDLLRDMNAEDRARQNKAAHEVEWLKNIYDLKYTVNE